MPWTCSRCRTVVEDVFGVCWSCGTTRDGVIDPHFRIPDSEISKPGFEELYQRINLTRDARLRIKAYLLIGATFLWSWGIGIVKYSSWPRLTSCSVSLFGVDLADYPIPYAIWIVPILVGIFSVPVIARKMRLQIFTVFLLAIPFTYFILLVIAMISRPNIIYW